jgi:hypothetical protein
MKNLNRAFLILVLLVQSLFYGQSVDSLNGQVKKISEKVIFLTEVENPQFMYYDDYGHYGFRGPETTKAVFKNYWFHRESCYYINYERYFDSTGNIIKDIWFNKRDSIIGTYSYNYDDQGRLKLESKISKSGTIYQTKYFFAKGNIVNIIDEVSDNDNLFSYKHQKLDDNGNILFERRIDNRGWLREYIFDYNSHGDLNYRIYKGGLNWDKFKALVADTKPKDSNTYYYKDIVNKYDSENRLTKNQKFTHYYVEDKFELELQQEIEMKYKDEHIIERKITHRVGKPFYELYEYDNKGRMIAEYCCAKDKTEAKRIKKYSYIDDYINSLHFIEFKGDEKNEYTIKFSYKFDSEGNWIEILKTVDDVELYKWLREIEYYD